MEMNTRIQVEHPITEQVIDFDLICEQIKVAAGEKISGKNYLPKLHSIECRINAEDPANDFRPSPGLISNLHLPGGHGVRIDTHVYSGYVIPPHYDSMIAKPITTAQSREEAISKMKRALEEFIVEGIKTTIPFHLKLILFPLLSIPFLHTPPAPYLPSNPCSHSIYETRSCLVFILLHPFPASPLHLIPILIPFFHP